MEELFLTTKDNVKIGLNLYETGHDSVLIMVHGWFMTKDSKPFLQMAQDFSKFFDVISIDCAGHGKSSGGYSFTVRESNDLAAAVCFAKERYKKVYLIGFSLGGALVLLHGATFKDVEKIVAVSPPSCFELIENHFWHPAAWIPTLQKCELKTWFSVRPDLKNLIVGEKTSPIEVIENVDAPILFIAGEKDPTVFSWHTEALFKKALCKKKYELFKDGIHAEDLYIQNKSEFINICTEWVLSD